jgi:hypothetical protein
VHVVPQNPRGAGDGAQSRVWSVGVFGALAAAEFRLQTRAYPEAVVTPLAPAEADIHDAAGWAFFRLRLAPAGAPAGGGDLLGFTVRVLAAAGGPLTVAARPGEEGYPVPGGSGATAAALLEEGCTDCVLQLRADSPMAGPAGGGGPEWKLGVMAMGGAARVRVLLSTHRRVPLRWGRYGVRNDTVAAGGWSLFGAAFDQSAHAGFRLELVPAAADSDVRLVMMKGRRPAGPADEYFPGVGCRRCRVVVRARTNLTGTWTFGVYGGTTGGEFYLRGLLLQACRCSSVPPPPPPLSLHPTFIPPLLSPLSTPRLPLLPLLIHSLPLSRSSRAAGAARRGRRTCVRL